MRRREERGVEGKSEREEGKEKRERGGLQEALPSSTSVCVDAIISTGMHLLSAMFLLLMLAILPCEVSRPTWTHDCSIKSCQKSAGGARDELLDAQCAHLRLDCKSKLKWFAVGRGSWWGKKRKEMNCHCSGLLVHACGASDKRARSV